MNSKNSILLVDPEFDPNTAADCNLLIKIDANSFSYAIIDKRRDQIKAVYDQQECTDAVKDLTQKIKTDSYFSLQFKEVKVSVYTENSLTVPNDFFEAVDLNEYAKYFNEDRGRNLYSQPFNTYGLTTVFTLTDNVDDTLSAALTNKKLYDHTAPLLSMAKQKSTAVYLDFSATSFSALYIKDQKLVFQNHYQIENSEEFNYYLLFIINQLNIDISDTEVNLSGIIHEGDANFNCLNKYAKNILFVHSTPNIENTILDDMPAHYYSSLLALDLCE